jgi:hypothetical protein
MQNGILNTTSSKEEGDWTLESFESPLSHLRWGLRKAITDIDVIQLRVYTIEEKALIDACEAKYPEVSHSPLGGIFYGHPYYQGFYPACLDPLTHLKGDVKKHVLCLDRVPVDEGNLEHVQSLKLHGAPENQQDDKRPREKCGRSMGQDNSNRAASCRQNPF